MTSLTDQGGIRAHQHSELLRESFSLQTHQVCVYCTLIYIFIYFSASVFPEERMKGKAVKEGFMFSSVKFYEL